LQPYEAPANTGPDDACGERFERADGRTPKSIETPSSGFYPVGVAAVTRPPAPLGLVPVPRRNGMDDGRNPQAPSRR